jgi:RNA polymerase sigma factor (sigma-70 family)
LQPYPIGKHLTDGEGGAGLEVIQRLLEKDETALRELMEHYGDYLMRTAYLLLKDRHAAEEAVQDTFIQAFDKIAQLKERDKLKEWLTRITVNRCRMKQRTWSWRHLLPFAKVEELAEALVEPGPDEIIMAGLRNVQLNEAVRCLAYRYREVITLYYFNEMNIREIAESVQSNENTIKARLARGRAQLKTLLEEGGGRNESAAAENQA